MTRHSLMPPDMDADIERYVLAIPAHMRQGLLDYLRYGMRPGQFLQAVLSNDLAEACARADVENQLALFAYVFVLTNYAPSASWGSPDRVRAWIERGRELLLRERADGAAETADA
jgi:hypothetical protein